MFWADEIADKVIARRPHKEVYRVNDSKTPSGRIHVGSLRGVVVHNVITEALRNRGVDVEYSYGFDSYDPMDGFPPYLDESFRQYMGMPLSEIPSPEPGYRSYAHYYGEDFINAFHQLGIVPTVYWTGDMYKSGEFNEAIQIALDKADVIRTIDREVSGAERSDDWYPLAVICPDCKKIGTTRVYAWDGAEVSFRCEPDIVKWAEGCGFEGKISPFNGNAKLAWKVEWAAKWFLFGVDVETAGKDHMTKNGSFDVTTQIVRRAFNSEEPIGREYPYEWLVAKGRAMSSSGGIGASAHDVVEMLPPYLLHFFIAKARLNRHLDFDPHGMTLPLLYDDYDQALALYHQDAMSDAGRVIHYTNPADCTLPEYTMRFTKVTFLIQMPHISLHDIARDEKGAQLTEADLKELELRAEYARSWLEKYAPEEAKFVLQTELPPTTLERDQKVYLAQVCESLQDSDWTGESIHSILHGVKNDMQLSPKTAFSAIYRIFLNKDQGPQAGWFLAALDRDFVLSRLKEASNTLE